MNSCWRDNLFSNSSIYLVFRDPGLNLWYDTKAFFFSIKVSNWPQWRRNCLVGKPVTFFKGWDFLHEEPQRKGRRSIPTAFVSGIPNPRALLERGQIMKLSQDQWRWPLLDTLLPGTRRSLSATIKGTSVWYWVFHGLPETRDTFRWDGLINSSKAHGFLFPWDSFWYI